MHLDNFNYGRRKPVQLISSSPGLLDGLGCNIAARRFKVSLSGIRKRLADGPTRAESQVVRQLLTPEQEHILENYLIYLEKTGMPASRANIAEAAGTILRESYPTAKNPGKSWLNAYLRRCHALESTQKVFKTHWCLARTMVMMIVSNTKG